MESISNDGVGESFSALNPSALIQTKDFLSNCRYKAKTHHRHRHLHNLSQVDQLRRYLAPFLSRRLVEMIQMDNPRKLSQLMHSQNKPAKRLIGNTYREEEEEKEYSWALQIHL